MIVGKCDLTLSTYILFDKNESNFTNRNKQKFHKFMGKKENFKSTDFLHPEHAKTCLRAS
jgi:hypothetical protein